MHRAWFRSVLDDLSPPPGVGREQVRGAKLGAKLKRLLFHPAVTGEGTIGRVNLREPLVDASSSRARGPARRAGRPTVRKAQLPGGPRMTKKRCRRRKRSGKPGQDDRVLHAIVSDNRPDTGPGWPGPEGR